MPAPNKTYLDRSLDVRKNALLGSPNKMKLAVFCSNVQRGTTCSNATGTHQVTWENVSGVARAVDSAGIEAISSCVHCGYNLTGNASGVCPECGHKIAETLHA